MKIALTQKSTVSTFIVGQLAENQYYIKATKAKTSQCIGVAVVLDDGVSVLTCAGKSIGKADTKSEAKKMAHEFFKEDLEYIGFGEEIE